jgi:hypothetical protein
MTILVKSVEKPAYTVTIDGNALAACPVSHGPASEADPERKNHRQQLSGESRVSLMVNHA